MNDKGEIYSKFFDCKSDRCIVIVHGLFGNSSEHHIYNASKYFVKNNYNVHAIDMYSLGKRQVDKNSISQQKKRFRGDLPKN